jgi:hypothetical protein
MVKQSIFHQQEVEIKFENLSIKKQELVLFNARELKTL